MWKTKRKKRRKRSKLGNTELSLEELGNLRDDFQNSDLPFRVDIVDWNNIDESFKKLIRQKYTVIKKL
jgi:uncharacterized protein